MKNVRTIILAAGKGTRMKSDRPKVLHEVCGKPMIDYVLDAVKTAGSLVTYVVLGHEAGQVKQHIGERAVAVRQPRLLGTADAVRSVAAHLKGYQGDVLVVCADTPLLQSATLRRLRAHHSRCRAACTVLTAVMEVPRGYGRIVRDEAGRVVAIREEKDASATEKKVREINVGAYCFRAPLLFRALAGVKRNKKKKEFYLTDVVAALAEKGAVVSSCRTNRPEEGHGVNSRRDLAGCGRVARQDILERLMASGVTIEDPFTTYVQADVRIGRDTVIRPMTVIEKNVRIGRRCRVGPFARLRPGTRIADDVEIGNFGEISRSSLERGTLMKHFGFVGDARVGARTNIGAGVVTANYDGKKKNRTLIAPQAFIGSDSILVAPVRIGKNAVTAAGCVVTGGTRVPPGAVMAGVPGKIIRKKTHKK